jgi:hypothetical protein
MLQEIQITNDNTNNKVMVMIEKTNNNIMDIPKQLIAIVMNLNIPKQETMQLASLNSDDAMILEKISINETFKVIYEMATAISPTAIKKISL